MANLHLSCAIKNCECFQYFVPEDNYRLPMKGDLPIDENSFIHEPEKPGIGVELEWELSEIRLPPLLLSGMERGVAVRETESESVHVRESTRLLLNTPDCPHRPDMSRSCPLRESARE